MTIAAGLPSSWGMTAKLLLSTLASLACFGSAAACVPAGEDCQDVGLFGECADGRDYSQPSPPRSLGAYLGDGARCPGQNYRCSVAVSGTDTIAVGGNSANNLEVATSADFTLTALPTPPVQPLAFSLRAPDTESRGVLQISSSNMEPVREELLAHAVYDVSIVAADGPNLYSRENTAIPTSASRFVVALWSNQDSGQNPPFEPSRLVDTSLRSDSPLVEQLYWDTFTISAAPGIHELAFTSDSMGSFVLEVEVVNN